MKSKKGVGISISYIVVIAIAALVLVMLVLWGTGSLGKSFQNIDLIQDSIDAEMTTARSKCNIFCNEAKQEADTLEDFRDSRYCTEEVPLGDVDHLCYSDEINFGCNFVVEDEYGDKLTGTCV